MANMGRRLVLILMLASCSSRAIRGFILEKAPKTDKISWKEYVPNYPERGAERLLAQLKRQNKTKYFLSAEEVIQIKNRSQMLNKKYDDLCSSDKRVFFPQGVEINDEFYFVLNRKQKPIQYIETEVCTSPINSTTDKGNEGQTCLLLADVTSQYATKCIQEKITKPMYLMSRRNPEQLEVKKFKINSCCSCFIDY